MVPVESPADNANELAGMGKLHIIWDTVALLPHNSTSRPTEGNIPGAKFSAPPTKQRLGCEFHAEPRRRAPDHPATLPHVIGLDHQHEIIRNADLTRHV